MHIMKYYIYNNGFIECDKETYEKYDGFKETDIERQKRILDCYFKKESKT